MEAANVPSLPPAPAARLATRVSRPDWGTDAWLSIAVTALFVGITSWWLTQDHSIPVFDAGIRLSEAVIAYEKLSAGHIGTALTQSTPYPPVSYLVSALGLWIGGFSVASAVIAQNLVFVPLLALGCYNVGRLAFSPRAGLLAVVFALGSPLITAQFHVAMIDAPETAMVAVAVWAILATERFSRLGVSAAAGAAVGLGLLTKEPFAFFVIGVLVVTAIRGGWSGWRGLAVFALVALVIALPWYINGLTRVEALGQVATHAGASTTAQHGIAPPRLSIPNLTWYFWNIVNSQLYAPLFVFAIIGGVWTIVGFARRRPVSPFAWELSVGAFVGWVGITETFIHDPRYSLPLLLYLAVFGSGWIVRLPLRWERRLATSALVLVATANTLAVSFGVGGNVSVTLPGAEPKLAQAPGVVVIYTNAGFLVAGPHRDGDVLALMRTLRRNGVRRVTWVNLSSSEGPPGVTADFSRAGLESFARLARLAYADRPWELGTLTTHDAILGHGPVAPGEPPPCVRLSDGTGVWIRLGNPNEPGAKDYCPSHHPAFY